ncbi:DNA-3-methyladenine glycosylase [Roseomonas nepalensis]|uniref:Putative 3-methyladenine DNA glycosylase n=1 Tax=Muricoccus nepalensis TaxID=1854500 RepID=A0A502GBF1_9PROT|nr:DNA-3-methyladenine glycosylase [Roseomonas nepalensis]TPG58033.1 DNA-3-methyladenine glycosylase [Roseomonas nepalensis]
MAFPTRRSCRAWGVVRLPTYFRVVSTKRQHVAPLCRAFFARPAADVAKDLIGATLLVDTVGGLVVETEAYDHEDPASHSYVGRTARNASMFGPPGHAYIYRSYGLHWCLNFVCGAEPLGSAVLIRALKPTVGIDLMRQRRGGVGLRLLCSGPGRLSQALGVTGTLDGQPLDQPPFSVLPCATEVPVISGPRIGITRGAETPWRFGLTGSVFLSRRFA